MKSISTVKTLRTGIVMLLSMGALALSACSTGDDTPDDYEFLHLGEDGATESVGKTAQAMLQTSLCSDPTTATITGTAGNDVIYGTAGNDIIFALGGDDLVVGKGGDDIICGGDGNDNLSGGDGNDHIEGGNGYNFIQGNNGDDVLAGGHDGNEIQGNAGNDEVHGGEGADTLYGGDDDDKIDGGAGNDYIAGGAGNDCMEGGSGNDNLNGDSGNDSIKGGDNPDYINCGSGEDTHESDASDGVNADCEVAGTVNCFVTCPCNVPGSHFEAFVTGNVTIAPSSFSCRNSSSTALAYTEIGFVAGGEGFQTGSGQWACQGVGTANDILAYPITQEEGQHCGDLIRNEMIAQGVNPAMQCIPW